MPQELSPEDRQRAVDQIAGATGGGPEAILDALMSGGFEVSPGPSGGEPPLDEGLPPMEGEEGMDEGIPDMPSLDEQKGMPFADVKAVAIKRAMRPKKKKADDEGSDEPPEE